MPPRARAPLGRNVIALAAVSFFTDVSSEMIYPLLPLFLISVLGASATALGAIEGAAESTASLLKLGSGWWSDRVRRRKPLVVAGYTLATLARPLIALTQTATQVLAVRLTDRAGKGIRTSPRDALIADSVDPALRGRAFGLHRAADHAGAVVGPLLAWLLLEWLLPRAGVDDGAERLRLVFALALVPGLLALATLIAGVRESPRTAPSAAPQPPLEGELSGSFWGYLAAVLLFTLGNATDAFLLLRASELGIAAPLIPLLWALLHVTKSLSSVPGGALSDRVGRRPLIVAGWVLYAMVYAGFAVGDEAWHAWALFAAYGVYFGLSEGAERALVADLVPARRRGAAFGWYNLAIGLGALPASLVFGVIWDVWGAGAAFTYGAALALAAAIGVGVVPMNGSTRT